MFKMILDVMFFYTDSSQKSIMGGVTTTLHDLRERSGDQLQMSTSANVGIPKGGNFALNKTNF